MRNRMLVLGGAAVATVAVAAAMLGPQSAEHGPPGGLTGSPPPPPEAWTRLDLGELVGGDLFNGPSNDFLGTGIAYGDGFVLAGSSIQQDEEFATIWTSPDGETWTRLRADGDLRGASFGLLATTGDGLVATGSRDGAVGVWASTDGAVWQLLEGHGPFDGEYIDGLASSPDGYLAWAVTDLREEGSAMLFALSPDGADWTVAPPWPYPGEFVSGVASYRGGWLAVGHLQDTEPQDGRPFSPARAWWSADGQTWFRAVVPDGNQGIAQVFVGADGAFAVGGPDRNDYLGPYKLYRTTDGREWQGPANDTFPAPQYASDGERIVRWAHQDGGSVAWSTDGSTWHALGALAPPDHWAELTVGAQGVVQRIGFADPDNDADVGVQFLRAE